MSDQKTYSIWLVTDGKPGHQNQSEGLVQALASRIPVEVKRLPVLPFWKTLAGKLFHKNFVLKLFPAPDLVIGAGHGTHKTLLLVSWLFGAKSIVLMKPSLPRFLFDLCLIPRHDGAVNSKRVIVTLGVLNRLEAAEKKKINQGVILVGGPSKHYQWSHEALVDQLQKIFSAMPHIQWLIADSRRTPEETKSALSCLVRENISYMPFELTDKDWLPSKLSESTYCWVTEDSVSMVYEALTAQNHVGLLPVRALKKSRVQQGVRKLVDEQYVTTYQDWLVSGELVGKSDFENEAQRCADIIVKQYRLLC